MSEKTRLFSEKIVGSDGAHIFLEEIYQAFKARLLAELVAEKPAHYSQVSASLNSPPESYRLAERIVRPSS